MNWFCACLRNTSERCKIGLKENTKIELYRRFYRKQKLRLPKYLRVGRNVGYFAPSELICMLRDVKWKLMRFLNTVTSTVSLFVIG